MTKTLKLTYKNESAFTRDLCDMMETVGARVLVFVGSGQGQTVGLPDRHLSWRGGPPGGLWVESKRRGAPQSTHQKRLMIELLDRGVSAVVLDYNDLHRLLYAAVPTREHGENKRRNVGSIKLSDATADNLKTWLESVAEYVRTHWETLNDA